MVPDQYVWLVWASAFLLPWAGAYIAFPFHRRAMIWASLFTTPFGLTEPLFVPAYWSPPSLFDLALRTGFDIESLIFCFGIGGIGAVLYNLVTGIRTDRVSVLEKQHVRHRYHGMALSAPFIAFVPLYLLPWNPIYPSIVAMLIGAFANVLCRPDLMWKTGLGGALFVGYYAVFVLGLEWLSPGYVERVWNLDALSGVLLGPIPIEELLFAASFGLFWSGVYEHFTWRRVAGQEQSAIPES